MTTVLVPNTDLVAVAWCKLVVPGIGVGTTLPEDNTTWAASGFVQVTSGVGGTSNIDVPLYSPLVQIDTWATRPNSQKPPYGQANNIIETIRQATYDKSLMNRVLDLTGNFPRARFRSASFVTEPARMPDPNRSYARYMVRMLVNWGPL